MWDFYTSLADNDRQGLSEVQRHVAAVCDLRQEVASGGFDSYFRNWGGDTALDALAGLGRVLGSEWEQVLLEAMQLLGPEYPTAIDDRETMLDSSALDATLQTLDRRFNALEAAVDADSLLSEYLAGT